MVNFLGNVSVHFVFAILRPRNATEKKFYLLPMLQILVKIAMFVRLVLSQDAPNLYNIWPRGSSIAIFSRSGSSKISTSLVRTKVKV